MKKKITALIPCRSGSTRVKNKNTKPFYNTTLVENKIKMCINLKKLNYINDIIINTDCEIVINIAKKYNLKTHLREKYYASSECPAYKYFNHIAKVTECDHILLCQVTCPIIKLETYIDIINKYQKLDNNFDSIITVKDVKEHLWLNNKPLNYTLNKSPNSQDLPDIKRITYGINILPREIMIENCNAIGNKPYLYTLDDFESIDIDTPFDFNYAEYVFKENNENIILNHISYECSDIDKSINFYTNILNFKEINRENNFPVNGAYLFNGNFEIHLIHTNNLKYPNLTDIKKHIPHVNHICFFIKNTDDFLKKLNDFNIEIDIVEINKLDIRIFIYDPDNNPIEIIKN
jgi:CMP-N,N'-diacetyllegionaminic acid synthase